MILVDTSAWVEFLRDTGSPVCNLVDEFKEENHDAILRKRNYTYLL